MQSLSSSTEIGSSRSCLYKVSLLKTCFFLIGCPSPGWCWQNQVLVGTPASLALQKQIYWLPKELSFTAEKKPTHRGYSGFPEAQGYQFNQLLFSFQDGEQQKPTKVHFRTQSRDLPQEELFEFRLEALFFFAPQFRLVLTSLLARIC